MPLQTIKKRPLVDHFSTEINEQPMNKYLRLSLSGLFLLLLPSCILVPKPSISNSPQVTIDQPLSNLEQIVAQKDEDVAGLRPGNEGKIYWADSIRQTEYCLVYLHGFSASGMEADPIHRELAQRYGMNLYVPRLFAHGITDEDAMLELTVEDYVNSAKEAVAIGKKMGNKVILMASSTGGSLSLYLAAEDPKIVGLLLLSPNIRIANSGTALFGGPFGLQIARLFVGSHVIWSHSNEAVKKYWTMRYRTEALVQLQILVKTAMRKATFRQVTQPVFLGYYYKNKKEQDDVVSVAAMLKMFRQLGTPEALKCEVSFPEAATHTIVSPLHSDETEKVKYELQSFIENTLKIAPLNSI